MDASEYDRIAQLERTHWWYVGMDRWLVGTVRALPGSARILDAGCGTGASMRTLHEFGCVTGVDVSPLALRHARRAPGALAQAGVAAIPCAPASFDLVVCLDVLYHAWVRSDAAALREFRRVLKPGGWLVMRVPAHDWLRGRHDAVVHTARRYSAPGLRRLLADAGFRVQRLTPLGVWLLPAAIVHRALQRLRPNGAPARSDAQALPGVINQVLAWALTWEAELAVRRRLPWGLSLAVAAVRGT